MSDLPNLTDAVRLPSLTDLTPERAAQPPRIRLPYGSLRPRSYSRFLTQEAERLLQHFGCEARVFDPRGLPLSDETDVDHPELRGQSLWSEGQVWTGPERHGA